MRRKTRNGARTGGAASLPNPATVVSALLVALLVGAFTLTGIALADPPPHSHGGDGDDGDGTTTQEIPVLVTFYDSVAGYYEDESGGTFYWFGDKIGSDGFLLRELNPHEAYSTDKTLKTEAIFRKDFGNIYINTKTTKKAGSGRSMFLGFSHFKGYFDADGNPIPGGTPDDEIDLPFDSEIPAVKRARLQTWRLQTLGLNQVVFQDMETGDIAFTPMHIKFELEDPNAVADPYKDAYVWIVAFGDPPGGWSCPEVNSWVQVTCVTNKTEWIVEPQDYPDNVVCLFSADTANTNKTLHGHYHMPFGLTVVIDQAG